MGSSKLVMVLVACAASTVVVAGEGGEAPPAAPPAAPPPWPLWDGKEAVTEYAKRVGLAPEVSVDVGTNIMGKTVPMVFKLIPAGKFTMGSPKDEKGRNGDEKPHEVTISKPFYMSKFEATQDQYEAVINYLPVNKLEKGSTRPVNCVSWEDAVMYCLKLGRKVSRDTRLPTEAEWEYACRAGTQTAFYTGNSEADLDRAGFYKRNIKEHVQPVGQKAPNAFGLYDMHGNAAEWCMDPYEEYPTAAVVDPKGPAHGYGRVVRGGAWVRDADGCRSACRRWLRSVDRPGVVTIRVAMSLPKKP